MAFTREQVREFISALKEDAELRELARAAILSDDFAALPGLVRANTEAIAALDARIDRLTERLETFIAATDLRFVRQEDRANAVEERLAAIEQQLTSINEHLTEHDERFDHIDQRLETRDERFDGVDRRLEHMDGRLDHIDGRLGRMDASLNHMDGRLGNVEGGLFESKYEKQVSGRLGRRFTNVRIVRLGDEPDMHAALDSGRITDAQWDDVIRTDCVVRGTSKIDRIESVIAIELSTTVDTNDVERAVRRAKILQRVWPNVLAAVDGDRILSSARSRADELQALALVQREAQPPAA